MGKKSYDRVYILSKSDGVKTNLISALQAGGLPRSGLG